jgi:hypothetical protein
MRNSAEQRNGPSSGEDLRPSGALLMMCRVLGGTISEPASPKIVPLSVARPLAKIDQDQCAVRFTNYRRHDIYRAANLRAVVPVCVRGPDTSFSGPRLTRRPPSFVLLKTSFTYIPSGWTYRSLFFLGQTLPAFRCATEALAAIANLRRLTLVIPRASAAEIAKSMTKLEGHPR